jgi:hypothetical protein
MLFSGFKKLQIILKQSSVLSMAVWMNTKTIFLRSSPSGWIKEPLRGYWTTWVDQDEALSWCQRRGLRASPVLTCSLAAMLHQSLHPILVRDKANCDSSEMAPHGHVEDSEIITSQRRDQYWWKRCFAPWSNWAFLESIYVLLVR